MSIDSTPARPACPLGRAAAGTALALLASVVSAPAAFANDHHAGHGHVAEEYTLELLAPTNDNTRSTALGINDDGDVVGIVRGSSAQPQWTTLWERHGDQVTSFNEAGTGILNDINDAGVAVGVASSKAVTLDTSGIAAQLPEPTALDEGVTVKNSRATSISENGEIAGNITLVVPHGDHTHDSYHPVKWDAAGNTHVLQLPAGGSGAPTIAEITDGGELLGAVTIGGKESATVWQPDGPRGFVLTPVEHDEHEAVATTISAAGVSQTYGRTARLTVSVSENATGKVTAKLGSKTVKAGRIATFTVTAKATGVTPTGKITLKVAGKSKTVKLGSKGRAIVKVKLPKSLKAGSKKVSVVYHGSSTVKKASAKTSIRIPR